MISDCDDFYGKHHPSFSWGKVTRRIVDPVTFTCYVDVINVPRIEDCSYETSNIAISQPRFGEKSAYLGDRGGGSSNVNMSRDHWSLVSSTLGSESLNHTLNQMPTVLHTDALITSKAEHERVNGKRSEDNENAWKPPMFPGTRSQVRLSTGAGAKITAKQSKNKVMATKSGASTATREFSLGAFFSQASIDDTGDADNQSIGSKSLSAWSVSDRSNAELSKVEMKLKLKMKSDGSPKSHKRSLVGTRSSDDSMMSIEGADALGFGSASAQAQSFTADIQLAVFQDNSSFSSLPQVQVDGRNLSPSPKVEKRTRSEKRVAASLKSCVKKADRLPSKSRRLGFRDDLEILEIPTLRDKEHYQDWEAIWYDEDELAEFRYIAFMEEAGLNVDDYD